MLDPVEVRRASAKDIADLQRLFEEAVAEQEGYRPGWRQEIGDLVSPVELVESAASSYGDDWGGGPCLVATIDDVPVGYCVLDIGSADGSSRDGQPVLDLVQIFVEPEARGIGVGSLLLAAAARVGRMAGCRRCEMSVLPGHREAKNFCEQHGLKARSIRMSGQLSDVLASVELDGSEEERVNAVAGEIWGRLSRSPAARRRSSEDVRVAAGCLVVRGAQVLLHRREEPPFRGWWSIPGGHLRDGETLAECAVREVREETGIEVRIVGFLGIAERQWASDAEAGRVGDRSRGARYVICNFLGVPVENADVESAEVARGDVTWADPDRLPQPCVPGVAEFVARSRSVIDRVVGEQPGFGLEEDAIVAVYSPPGEA